MPCLHAADLQWQGFEGYRSAPLAVTQSGMVGFTETSSLISGISFTNRLSDARSLTNQIFLNGSGVAAGDFDGDGLSDLYFCGLDSANRLYRNLGDWRFEDVTASAGVACADQASTGCVFADIDGDRDLDLLVNGIASGTRLFLNEGRGQFREMTDQAGLRGGEGSNSMALADIDGDGLLDLYVVNYRNDTMRDMPDIEFKVGVTNGEYRLISMNDKPASAPELQGRFTFDGVGGVLENGEADSLYRNLGGGRFEKLIWTDGTFLDESSAPIKIPYDWGLSVIFRDLNGDGSPDLYVCNDFQSPDRIWINDGKGQFRVPDRDAIRQTSLFSMGVDVADVDRDGKDDIFVVDMLSRDHARRQVQVMDARAFAQVRSSMGIRPQVSRNTLFHNRGNGTYAELARYSGIDASDWSWSPVFLDVDLDGYEDLLVTTGHWRDAQHADVAWRIDEAKRRELMTHREQLDLRRQFPRLDTPNVAFRNRGDLTFEETGEAWGFDSRKISQGIALADLDNDGDLDVIVNSLNSGPTLYRNDSSGPRIRIRLRGKTPNTFGVGAVVRVTALGLPVQQQEIMCGGRYLSGDDLSRTFAVRNSEDLVKIEVTWRSGRCSLITGAPANRVFELTESNALTTEKSRPKSQENHFFEDVSELLNHRHKEELYDDFARQPLLARKLSQLGPGVTWFDFNSDGFDDLLIGTGRGGRMAVFRNDGKGGFVRQRAKLLETVAERDMTAILGWRSSSSAIGLLIGNSNYEDGSTNAPAVREFSLVTGAVNENLLRSPSSTGPLALADVDADGDLDLFVGGRVIAARYPEPSSSALLRYDKGKFHADSRFGEALAGIGLVSSALFSDLSGDGCPELIVACEWGPLHIFQNRNGNLLAWNPKVRWTSDDSAHGGFETLSDLSGWWNSVAAGDFNGDGRMDLVVGNWGRNVFQRPSLKTPLRLHYGDVDGSGSFALIESKFDPGMGKYVPHRDRNVLSAVFPMFQDQFPTFVSFSTVSTSELLGSDIPPMRHVETALLDSMVMLNRGEFFEARPLPLEAQISPVFGIACGDLDGDGNDDLFLAQNFFGVSATDSRQDAGTGLLLRGDGQGGFSAIASNESGFALYGEARGAALSDFDHDGRLDVVVGQNLGETKLYRNVRAVPGLRLILKGATQNLQAVGATARAVLKGGNLGPVREIRLGGGYWSQDSNQLLLGSRSNIEAIDIRWPGGIKERVPVPKGAKVLSRTIPRNR